MFYENYYYGILGKECILHMHPPTLTTTITSIQFLQKYNTTTMSVQILKLQRFVSLTLGWNKIKSIWVLLNFSRANRNNN